MQNLVYWVFFKILSENMFNIKEPDFIDCDTSDVYAGDCSYIQSVKWTDFMNNPNYYIEKSIEIKNNWDKYNIVKQVS